MVVPVSLSTVSVVKMFFLFYFRKTLVVKEVQYRNRKNIDLEFW